MWPYPWTHVGTPSHLGHMDRVAATMPSQAHAGAAQEAPDIGQWEGQDVPLVRPSSCNVKGGIPSSRRYLPTYLPATMQCPTALGLLAVALLQCTPSLPGGSAQWKSCNALCHSLGAVGSLTPAMHCRTAWGQWAVERMQCTASLPGGRKQWNSCNALPLCLGSEGSGTSAMYCLTSWGQWAVELLQCTASLPEGSGQWKSCNALPHRLEQVGSGTPVLHCPTA